MKRLNEIISCPFDVEIGGIATDSRNVVPGDLYVATKGFNVDHYDFIDDAIKKGAVAVVVDRGEDFSVPTIHVTDIDQSLVSICEAFYDVSSSDFSFVGITGTDGKTTTATITRNLLNQFIPTAYIGTNGLVCGDEVIPTSNTTPAVEELYRLFSVIKKHKCKVVVMEVSSEAMLHHRVDSIQFDVVGYTNITEDHLNVHKTLENYRNCKFRLATLVKDNGKVIINGDDKNCQLIPVKSVFTYGLASDNNCVISDVNECKDNTIFTLTVNGSKTSVVSPFSALYNVYNVTLALLIAEYFSISFAQACPVLKEMSSVPGRREVFHAKGGYDILLDYAHTENSILNLLKSLTHYPRIIVVTGAAGGREKEKRPKIGNILFQYASYIFFTMDDPRDEDPKEIAKMIVGSHQEDNYTFVRDRREAIFTACKFAKEGDVVAVIGKGRDSYMAIGSEKLPYETDYNVILDYLKEEQ